MVFDEFSESDFGQVINLLVAHGVEHLDAQRYLTSIVHASKSKSSANGPTEFFELYGQGGLKRLAAQSPFLECSRLGSL